MSILLTNATIVLRDAVITNGWLLIEADLIAGVGAMPHAPSIHGATVRDLGGALLMPGVIDLHCDTIEKMVQPRPGVEINGAVALHITDRLLVNSGVTSSTRCHSTTPNLAYATKISFKISSLKSTAPTTPASGTTSMPALKSVVPVVPLPSVILSTNRWSNWCRLWIIVRVKASM